MSHTQPDDSDVFDHSAVAAKGLRNKSVRGALYMATLGGTDSAVRLLATVVLARELTPDDVGLVGMVMVLIGMIEVIKDLGLQNATVQSSRISHFQVSTLFWINVLFGAFLAILLGALSPLIAWFYSDGRLVSVTFPLALALFLGAVSIQHEALLVRRMQIGSLSVVRLVSTVTSSGIAILMAVTAFGYWSLVARELVRSVIYLTGVLTICRWRPSLRLRPTEVKEQLSFGKDVTFAFFINSIVARIDGLLVGKFFGSAALGYYRQAQGLVMAPIEQFNAPLFSVAQPGLSALQSQHERYRRYYQLVTWVVAATTLPLGAFLALYSSDFTLAVLGVKWLPAAPFVCAFAIAMALRPTSHTLLLVLMSLGRGKTLFWLELLHSVVFFALLVVGLQFGAVGVAAAYTAAVVALIAPKIHYSLKDTPVNVRSFAITVRFACLSTTFMGLVLAVFKTWAPIEQPIASLFAGIGIGSTAYLLPWLLLPSGRAELSEIVREIRLATQRKRPA